MGFKFGEVKNINVGGMQSVHIRTEDDEYVARIIEQYETNLGKPLLKKVVYKDNTEKLYEGADEVDPSEYEGQMCDVKAVLVFSDRQVFLLQRETREGIQDDGEVGWRQTSVQMKL